MYDLVIRNGRLIDPANHIDDIRDLAVQDGKIAQVGKDLPKGRQDVDATDCIVTPGLIDIHTHVYEHATLLGINPDDCCLSRGKSTSKYFSQFFFYVRHFRSDDCGRWRQRGMHDIPWPAEIYLRKECNSGIGLFEHRLSWSGWRRVLR